MADTRWFEETKLLITLWSEEAVQHLKLELNTMHNKKLVWDKISQGMADACLTKNCLIRCCCFRGRIFLLLAFEASFASIGRHFVLDCDVTCLVYLNFRRREQNHN